jgi:hypothetical protein
MSDIITITQKNSPTILDCSTPGCGFHVEFNPDTLPIPALIETDKVLKKEMANMENVYLKCDNPVTPHINMYKIKIK